MLRSLYFILKLMGNHQGRAMTVSTLKHSDVSVENGLKGEHRAVANPCAIEFIATVGGNCILLAFHSFFLRRYRPVSENFRHMVSLISLFSHLLCKRLYVCFFYQLVSSFIRTCISTILLRCGTYIYLNTLLQNMFDKCSGNE